MRALAVLPLFALCAAAPEPVVHDTLAPDAEARWVAFELTPAKQIRFAMTVDGRPVTALLDTGVSVSVLSRRFVDAAQMPVRPGAAALAIGGAVASGWVDPQTLHIGALTRRGGRVATAILPDAATGGMPVDMLVGRDLTEGYALDIDYDARRFRLLPSGRLPFRGSAAPLRIAGTWPSYVTELDIGGARIARVMVDTGDGGALTLRRPIWNSLAEAARSTSTTLAFGIGGPVVVDVAIVPVIRSGTLTARDVEIRIEPDSGYTASVGMNARIGSGFLAGYRVLLDPGAGRMVLSRSKLADAPPLRSTSGLLLRAETNRLTVLHVMRGGPAENGGWRAGDAICSVDGVPVSSAAPLNWPVDTPGRTVGLVLCDGTARTLKLRAFY